MRRAFFIVCIVGCATDETETVPPVEPVVCEPLELALPDGRCVRPGMTPEDCLEGFAHDGEYACLPVLPGEPCPEGQMAVPGEAACRPVMACSEGKWGDIAIEPTTEHVDGSYTGLDSDGSAQ